MIKGKVFSILCLLIAGLLITTAFTSCERPPDRVESASRESVAPPEPYPVNVGGITFEESPQTIISLSPYLTELVFGLGYGNRLVGVSSYCDYPEQAKGIQSFGSGAKPEIDAIIAAKPDLLLCQSELSLMDKSQVEGAGIKVLTIAAPPTINAVYQAYTSIAVVVEGKVTADAAARKVYTELDTKVSQIMEKEYPFESFVYIAAPNMAIATADTLESNVLSLFGSNIANDGEAQGYDFPLAKIVEADPDIIFLASPMTIADLKSNDSLSALSAVKAGRVYVIDNKPFERPSIRIIEQLTTIDEMLSPAQTEAP